eukprot:29797-Pelagococcus_subviridis.AAC.8
MARTGYPWSGVSVSPFCAYATRTSCAGSSALRSGMLTPYSRPAPSSSTLSRPYRCTCRRVGVSRVTPARFSTSRNGTPVQRLFPTAPAPQSPPSPTTPSPPSGGVIARSSFLRFPADARSTGRVAARIFLRFATLRK